jgi:hypothetical protein
MIVILAGKLWIVELACELASPGLTQVALAARLGVSFITITGGAGKSKPPSELFRRLPARSRAVGCASAHERPDNLAADRGAGLSGRS